jgi:butyrate kinase
MVKRVYEVDPLVCERCGGEMRVVAFIIDPQVVDRILRHLVLKADHRVRGPPGWADLEAASRGRVVTRL